MRKKIKDIEIYYEIKGNKSKKTIIFLHGWGQNVRMMEPLTLELALEYQILLIDLPGFGNSDEPLYPWSIEDYAESVYLLTKELNIKNPIVIGHSFGGKVALSYATKYEVSKLVILASPFKKEITKLSMKTKILKMLNKIKILEPIANKLKNYIGSEDYKNASLMMKQILTKHINNDISDTLNKIKAPTLLIWGTLDEAVPLERAYELEKLINNAGVVELVNGTHYAYLEQLSQVNRILKVFFESRDV